MLSHDALSPAVRLKTGCWQQLLPCEAVILDVDNSYSPVRLKNWMLTTATLLWGWNTGCWQLLLHIWWFAEREPGKVLQWVLPVLCTVLTALRGHHHNSHRDQFLYALGHKRRHQLFPDFKFFTLTRILYAQISRKVSPNKTCNLYQNWLVS